MEPSSRPFGAADRRDSAKATSKVSASWLATMTQKTQHAAICCTVVLAFQNSTTCMIASSKYVFQDHNQGFTTAFHCRPELVRGILKKSVTILFLHCPI